jgi:outer membrane immunogenic protein
MFSRAKLTFVKPLSTALVSLGALAMATPALAAAQEDSPWHGFYVGANAGGAWSTADADATLSVNSSAPLPVHPIAPGDITAIDGANVKGHLPSAHKNTFTGGLEGGYNYIMGSDILLGIETDINYFHIRRSGFRTVASPVNPARTFTVDQSLHTDFLWTLRARAGYIFAEKFLVFASGGLALTETHYNADFFDNQGNAVSYPEHSGTRTGWTVGGGAGYAITPNILAKAEYLYQDFGSSRYTATSANGYLTLNTEAHLRSHLFRAGIDYRF